MLNPQSIALALLLAIGSSSYCETPKPACGTELNKIGGRLFGAVLEGLSTIPQRDYLPLIYSVEALSADGLASNPASMLEVLLNTPWHSEESHFDSAWNAMTIAHQHFQVGPEFRNRPSEIEPPAGITPKRLRGVMKTFAFLPALYVVLISDVANSEDPLSFYNKTQSKSWRTYRDELLQRAACSSGTVNLVSGSAKETFSRLLKLNASLAEVSRSDYFKSTALLYQKSFSASGNRSQQEALDRSLRSQLTAHAVLSSPPEHRTESQIFMALFFGVFGLTN